MSKLENSRTPDTVVDSTARERAVANWEEGAIDDRELDDVAAGLTINKRGDASSTSLHGQPLDWGSR